MSCATILPCHLAYLQSQIVAGLTDSVSVMRRTATMSDGAGGLKPTSGDGWTTITTLNGLLVPNVRRTPQERVTAGQINAPVDHFVYVVHGADVRAEDKLIVGLRTFHVQGIPKGESIGVLDQVNCVELQK